MMAGLSPKQEAFVEHYLTSWNASDAARRARYGQPQSQGPRLLQNVEIQARIEERLAELKMGADEVLSRLREQARNEFVSCVRIDPESGAANLDLRALEKAGKLHLIKGIKYDRRGNQVIEWADPQTALELLGRHHRLFAEGLHLTGSLELTKAYGGDFDPDKDV